MTGPRSWRDGHQAARAAADPEHGPGTDGQETQDRAERAARATHAFNPAHVVDWDSDVPFDLRGYYEHPDKVEAHEVDAAAVVDPPLSRGALAALRHLHEAEGDTVRLLRDLLVTPSHKEARVTAFLTTWAYEQHWVARALRDLLDAAGAPRDEPRGPVPTARRAVEDRTRPLTVAVRTNLLGEDFVALPMVRGLLDSLALRAAYLRLAAIEGRPELTALCERVARMKDRHADFYQGQARARLGRSAGARALVRAWLVAGRWQWPGTRYDDRARVADALRHVLAGPAGRDAVTRIDRTAAALPGCAVAARFAPVAGHLQRYGFGTATSTAASRA